MCSCLVLHISDCHLFEDDKHEKNAIKPRSSLRRVLEAAVVERLPDAIIASGDIAQEPTLTVYQKFQAELARFASIPTLVIPGNHDNGGLMETLFEIKPITVKGWSFIPLDTYQDGLIPGFVRPEALMSLRNHLQSVNEPNVVVGHHPIFNIDTTWLDNHKIGNHEAVFDVLRSSTSTKAYLCGHVHLEHDQQLDGVRQITTPSTCWQFAPKASSFRLDNSAPGWRWLELYSDGSIKTNVCRLPKSNKYR